MQYGVKIDNYKRAKDSENVKNNMKIEASRWAYYGYGCRSFNK